MTSSAAGFYKLASLRHDPGLTASPRECYILKVPGGGLSGWPPEIVSDARFPFRRSSGAARRSRFYRAISIAGTK